MAIVERASVIDFGVMLYTPYYNTWIDYGPAMDDGANTFFSMATSICPVDTGFLMSTIDSDSDPEGFSGSADADYAEYVDAWSSFFDSSWECAMAVADAHCEAIQNEALEEESERIRQEMEEELERIEEELEEQEQQKNESEEQKAQKEEELAQAEDDLSEAESNMDGDGGEGDGGDEDPDGVRFLEILMALLIDIIEIIIEEIFKIVDEIANKVRERDETQNFYEDILSFY